MAEVYLSSLEPESGSGGDFIASPPYPGLRPFAAADVALFFGRQRLVDELLTQLEFQPLVLLVGRPGCGKTSTLQAGVIPRWKEKYPGGRVLALRPGRDPFAALAQGLSGFPEGIAAEVRKPSPHIFRTLQSAPPPPNSTRQSGDRTLIALDCLEDLFTQVPAGATELRSQFFDALVDLARLPDSGIQCLLALRDDFIAHLGEHDQFHRIADNNLQRITSLKGEALRECITVPAQNRGVRLEDGLADEIGREAESADGLMPLLQDALRGCWRAEELSGRLLRRATWQRMGGVAGALPQRLDRWFAAHSGTDQTALRQLLLAFVILPPGSEGKSVATRAIARPDLESTGPAKLIDELLAEELLVSHTLPGGSAPVLELAHESLVLRWPTFRSWWDELRAGGTLLQRLQEDAQRWAAAGGRDKRDLCWRGHPLEQAHERQQRGDFSRLGGLSPLAARFLQSSLRAQAFRKIRNRVLGSTAGLVALASLGAAVLATAKFRDATAQQHAAEIKAGLGWLARAQQAEGTTDAGFFAAFATGFEGAGREEPPAAAKSAENPLLALLPGTRRDPHPRYLTLQDTPGRKIEADRRMASAPKPFLWSAPFQHNDGPVQTLAFSLDGKRLASAGGDGRVRLWSVALGNLERTLDGSTSAVWDLGFAPSGTILASGHADGTLILWEADTGKKLAALQGHSGPVRAVAFSPAGTQVASGGDDGGIKIWNVEAGGETRAFPGHSGAVNCLAFGPGGIQLASGGNDRFVRVWDVARSEEVNILSGHVNPVQSLAFSPSGRELASASPDEPIFLWDLPSHKTTAKLPVPGPVVHGLTFSPDGSHLAAGGEDGRFRLWALSGRDREPRVFAGHSGAVNDLAFGPDGKLVATAGADRTVKLWAVRDAWKNPAQIAAAPEAPPPAGAAFFDWYRYVREGWTRFDEHGSALVWEQLPQGLSYSDPGLPGHSWLGVLRQNQGANQTRQLVELALEAQNWDAAALLHATLPQTGPEATPGHPEAAKLLETRVRDDQAAGRTALAEWRMRQGDLLFARDPDWAAMRAETSERAGDISGALAFYRHVDSLPGWQALARLSPDAKEAVAAWRKVLAANSKPSPDLFLAAGKRAADGRDAAAVREFFTEGTRRFPNNRDLQLAFAAQLVAAGAVDEALAQFQALAEGKADSEQQLVAVLQETGTLDQVLQLLQAKAKALKSSGPAPAALDCLQRLARLYQAANQPDNAIAVLKDRISYFQGQGSSANLSGPLDDLARALVEAGKREEAVTVMRARVDLLKLRPPGAELLGALRELQSTVSSDGDVIFVLQERLAVLQRIPGEATSAVLGELGTALAKAGRGEEAFPVWEQRVAAFQAEGKDPAPAIREWAAALEAGGKSPEAWNAYRRIAELPGASVDLVSEVARWGALRGFRNDANALFDQASARAANAGERALVGSRRGWAFLESGAFEEAFSVLGILKSQLEARPETATLIDSELLAGLAAAEWRTNRKGAALDDYEFLWKRQKPPEQWENPDFVRNHQNLPETGRKALLELQAVWQDRMHRPQPGTKP